MTLCELEQAGLGLPDVAFAIVAAWGAGFAMAAALFQWLRKKELPAAYEIGRRHGAGE